MSKYPEIDVETVQPDLENLKIEMNRLREHLKDQSMELREKIQEGVAPHVSVRISRSI